MTAPLHANPSSGPQLRRNAARWRCGGRRRGAGHSVGAQRRCPAPPPPAPSAPTVLCWWGSMGHSCRRLEQKQHPKPCKHRPTSQPKPASNHELLGPPPIISFHHPLLSRTPAPRLRTLPSVTSPVTLGLRDNHHDLPLEMPQSQVSFQSQWLPHLRLPLIPASSPLSPEPGWTPGLHHPSSSIPSAPSSKTPTRSGADSFGAPEPR